MMTIAADVLVIIWHGANKKRFEGGVRDWRCSASRI